MLNKNKIIIISLATLLLSACANSPPKITPSTPLVSEDVVVHSFPVSEQIINAIKNKQTSLVLNDHSKLTLGQIYFSALGFYCIEINEQANNGYKSTYNLCEIDGQWQRLPSA